MQTRQLVSMISVTDMERSLAFYRRLGFEVGDTFVPAGATGPSWAWLRSGEAQLMLSKVSEPVVAAERNFLFYVYTEDVDVAHADLADAELNPGEITKPFYNPRGEFRLVDPDGYVLMITHT